MARDFVQSTLCYYVTGHGFGHVIRTCQVLKVLPADVRVIVKTMAPARVFTEELPGRDVQVVHGEYDCGAVQSDSLTTLPAETMARYKAIAQRNSTHLQEEVDFLQRENVTCVVSDIVPFAFTAARAAGVLSVAVCNFTWHDIYQDYARTPDDFAVLNSMASEYGTATDAFITPLAVPGVGDVFPRTTSVPLIARHGTPRRAELAQAFGRKETRHFALLYLGGWGMALDWANLARYTDWVFLTETAPPVRVPNVAVIDQTLWRWADIAASVDAVVAKPGYGTLTECIANSVPLVYVPRPAGHFAEQDALLAGMARWGGGAELTPAQFASGDWSDALSVALAAQPDTAAFETNGADVVARRLMTYLTDNAAQETT